MKFYVTEGSRVKVATKENPIGQLLNGGDSFEADEEEVKNLLNSGAIATSKGGSAPKSKKTKKSGKEVETPSKEGKLDENGETPEIK